MRRSILMFVFLGGCAATAQPINERSMPVVVDLPFRATPIRRVAAVVCSDEPFGKSPPNEAVLVRLKERAAALGADGLYRVSYTRTGIRECGLLAGRAGRAMAFKSAR